MGVCVKERESITANPRGFFFVLNLFNDPVVFEIGDSTLLSVLASEK